jgi:hypothetical protein
VGVLAHVLEAAGIATVALASVRGQAERVRAPRALYCEFPLGRPLGRPQDPAFQHRVLAAAFALLETPRHEVPVLATFPEVVTEQVAEPLTCTLPPRFDPSVHPAADEARGLRDAFARAHRETGRSSFGKVLTVEQVPAALEAFARIAGGAPWDGAGLPGDPVSVASDVRTYYEEAAVALAGHVPEARRAEAWFVERTEAGRVVRAAQKVMRQRKDPHFLWYYLLPLGWRDRTSAT